MKAKSDVDLHGDTARAVGWVSIGAAGSRFLGFVGLALLARLLLPEHFGLVAVATAVLVYVEALGDLGTGAALIYWPREPMRAARITLTVNLVLSVLWVAVGWPTAPAVASFFGSPEATSVIRAMLWLVPLRFLGNVPDALLRRDLRFRKRVVPEIAGAALKLTASIAGALAGWGVWSLVAGLLAGQALSTVLLWRAAGWWPRPGLDLRLARSMLRYGAGIVAVNLLAALTHHFDLLVVGRFLGAEPLGHYQVAARLPQVTLALLIWVSGKVLFPAFSRLHARRESLGPFYLEVLRATAALALPIGVGLLLLAGPIISVVFGAGWEPAVPVLQGLAVYMTMRALGTHAGDVLKGTGRTALLAGLGVLKAALVVPTLWILGPSGIGPVAAGLATAGAVGSGLTVAVAARRLELGPGSLLRAVAPPLVACGAMGAGLLVLPEPAVHSWLDLVARVAAGGLLYALALWAAAPRWARRLVGRLPGLPRPTTESSARRSGGAS